MLFIVPRLLLPVATVLVGSQRAIRWAVLAGVVSLGLGLLNLPTSFAGGGPENVFLLVNPTSQDSLTVANHYIALRKIPPANVFYLSFQGSKGVVTGSSFRSQILLPALAEIERRHLTSQIDYLVYSCDYPWRINFTSDFPKKKFPAQLSPRGSLTGLTYLATFVKAKRQEVVSPTTNWYFVKPMGGITISRAFRSSYHWAAGGRRTGAQGLTYIISSMLGVTNGRGNKVPEIINSLRLAQKADGTKPAGTVYFMKHKGPRSTPRHQFFAAAATDLRRAGVAAKVLEGKFPENKAGIVGLTCGTAYANLGQSGCRFLPGAFCDNLTSYGAIFSNYKPPFNKKTGKKNTYQLTVADFIRHGATGASGTVFEPYNIQQKFPLPSVHVHYANGCSLGESFYQSVSGPYQQLLVGDPLCQPWADIPEVSAADITPGAVLRGLIEIKPEVNIKNGNKKGKPIKQFELYVDGKRTLQGKPGETLTLDTTTLQDGHHELRIVAVDDTPIETQGRMITNVIIKNSADAISLSTKKKKVSSGTKYVTIKVASTVKTRVDVYCNSLKLGSVPTGKGVLRIATNRLGTGPVTLYAVSEGLRCKPLQLEIAH